MSSKSIPDETQRLAALRRLRILDTEAEADFDDMTRIASQICGTPISLVSLVDEKRQWFKSKHGLSVTETPREHAFCAHVIEARQTMIIENALEDPRFKDNPLVLAAPEIRFYAGAPLIDAEGNALGTLCVIDRKPRQLSASQIESLEALARQVTSHLKIRAERENFVRKQRTFDLISNSLDVVIWMSDPQKNKMLFISQAYERIWKRPCQEVLENPMSFLDSILPEDKERILQLLPTQVQGQYDETYRIKNADGAIKWIHDKALPVQDENGDVVAVVGIATDITEARRQEDLVFEEKEKFEMLVNHIPVMLSRFNEQGEFVWCNPEWQKVLGWSLKSMQGRNMMSLFYPKEEDRQAVLAHMMSGQEVWKEFEPLTKDGQVVPTSWTNVRLSSGEYIGIGIDISERRKYEKKLAEQHLQIVASSKMSSLGEMASGIAHEINNPLAIIQSRADLLKLMIEQGTHEPEKLKEGLEKILKTTKRIARIIHALRAFSRNGEKDPFEICSLSQIIEDGLELSRERFRNHEIEIRLSLASDLQIECRAIQLTQVFVNLLNNAHDAVHGRPEAWVEVAIEKYEDLVVLTVTDSGPGIPRAVAERIMEPFYTTKEVGRGTGLGLSIARGIIEEHGGRLEYNPDHSHTQFAIFLPLRQRGSNRGSSVA